MKKFIKDFCKRGLMFAWGGPFITVIVRTDFMYLTRNSRIKTGGRLLLCLLLVMLCLGGWNVTGYCAEKAQGINVNGGLNTGISVDPFKKTKGWQVDGVLGTDFLERHDAIIDYPHSRMYLIINQDGDD